MPFRFGTEVGEPIFGTIRVVAWRKKKWCGILPYMTLRDIRKTSVKNKKVLLRVDYNIAVDRRGRLRDLSRIQQTLPTITWLLKHGAAVIVISHRGRPSGRTAALSLKPMVTPLQKLLKRSVQFLPNPIFLPALKRQLEAVKPGQVVLLENIRFETGEATNSARLAKRLASFADILVNDAFADSHRAHASIAGVARYLPAFAGLLVQQEVAALSSLLKKPRRPYVAVLGGAKISTKLHLVHALLQRADRVLLGGALANTVLQAEGLAIGKSLSEPTMLRAARGLTVKNKHLTIPCDVIVASSPTSTAKRSVRAVGAIRAGERILDIGPDTVNLYRQILRAAKTIVWNGPMGLYEVSPFDHGTRAIARAVATSVARSYVGGGETIDAIKKTHLERRVTWCSTGGGAMLEFLEGKTLPGLIAVSR